MRMPQRAMIRRRMINIDLPRADTKHCSAIDYMLLDSSTVSFTRVHCVSYDLRLDQQYSVRRITSDFLASFLV